MSEKDFHQLINEIVSRSGIPRGSRVAMCQWQAFGKSGPVMAHRVKERGKWNIKAITLDLEDDPSVWSKSISNKKLPVVLADDFVGTGDTISRVEPRLRLLLDTCPSVYCYILLVAGFAEGVQRIRHLEKMYKGRVKIVVGKLLYNSDTCFSDESNILNQEERQDLTELCVEFGTLVGARKPKGYGELGALFSFPESIPNSTLPFFWYDEKPQLWIPLLPASG